MRKAVVMTPEYRKEALKRFKTKFKRGKKDECWEWTGATFPNGYGAFVFTIEGKKTSTTASRVALTLFGAVPMVLPISVLACHKCNNKKCVNPNHLYLGDAKTNAGDCVRAGTHPSARKKKCPQGHSYSGPNIRHELDKFGRTTRRCITCRRIRDRKKYAKRKALNKFTRPIS